MYHVEFPGMGISLTVNPTAFSIGSFEVYWYGIIIGVGFLLALVFALKNLKRFGIPGDGFIDCVLFGLIFGVIGARLYYVILAIYGGVIGGLAAACIVARIKKIPIPAMLDIGVMGFLIGQGLGRWGNLFNQEAFGTPTDLPWRMVSENTGGVGVHPCFLYESIWCLLGFFLLFLFSRKWRKYDGQIFLLYLVWYGAERMIVEGLRTDSLYTPLFNLRVSQILAGVTMIVGIVLLIVFRKRTKKAADTFVQTKVSEESAAAVSDTTAEETEMNITETAVSKETDAKTEQEAVSDQEQQ